jgi:hypothetical protein
MAEEYTSSNFEEMILASVKEKKEAYDADNDERVRQAVTTEFRYRGDYFGTFNTLKTRNMEYVGGLGKGLVTFPVVPRAIRSKTATMLATSVKIELKPARELPEIEAGVDLATNILARAETNIFDEDFEINTAHLRQTQRLCYVRIFNNQKKGIRYQEQERGGEPTQRRIHGKIYGCGECGLEVGEEYVQPDEAGVMHCPGEDGEGCPGTLRQLHDEKVRDIVPFVTKTKRTGEPDIEIISALLTRIDDLPCVGLQFDNTGWFNVNQLVPKLELQMQFPQFKDKLGEPNPEKWSAGTAWWYALTKERGNFWYAGGLSDGYKKGLRQYFELEKWYYTPDKCLGYTAKGEWELEGDGEDNLGFSMKEGETIEKAVRRHFGAVEEEVPPANPPEGDDIATMESAEAAPEAESEYDQPHAAGEDFEFTGICCWIANGKLLKVEPYDVINDFNPYGWTINASSYYPLGEERLNKLQDAITNILSMIYSAGLKRQLAALFANPNLVDEESLRKNHTGGFIFAKTESGLPLEQINWQQQLFYLDPPGLDALVWELAQLIIQIQKEESGVYDETVGVANDKNQTMGGRLQAANQSLQLMLSPAQAKRKGKIETCRKLLKKWQTMDNAAFQMIKGSFNEEWKPQDIAAFKNLDIDSDVVFKVVEGTDIPRAINDPQGALMAAFQMGLFDPQIPLPPVVLVKLLRALGVEYDPKNTDATRRLAQKRLKLLKTKVANVLAQTPMENAFVIVEEPLPQPAPPGMETVQRKILDPQLEAAIMADERLQAHETENHQVMMEFFVDHINGELGRDHPNTILLWMLDVFYKQHLTTMDNMMAREAATQGRIEGTGSAVANETARALSGEEEREAAALEAEAAGQEKEIASEEDRQILDAEEKERGREHEIEKTIIGAVAKGQGGGGKSTK